MHVPNRFTHLIESWLPSLTTETYNFPLTNISYPKQSKCIFIGDIHADPRGFMTALYISNLVDHRGIWTGGSACLVLLGDVLDGKRMSNPTITKWDEIICLRMILTLKQDAHQNNGNLIWVIGNHDLAGPMGHTTYLHESHAESYLPKTRQQWFKPGEGILSYYMAKCGVLASKIGDTLVSHAGITIQHLPYILERKGATYDMRMWLLHHSTTPMDAWFHSQGAMVHRLYDIQPNVLVPLLVQKNLLQVAKQTNTKHQIIGHNFRPMIQCIHVERVHLFLIDTGISRSFGLQTKVTCLYMNQHTNTVQAMEASSITE